MATPNRKSNRSTWRLKQLGQIAVPEHGRARVAERKRALNGASGLVLGAGGAEQREWWVLYEPEVHLGDNVLVPDIAGWVRADVPAFDTSVACYVAVPRWVAEVLSPSTERLDRIKKLRPYHQTGIAFVWLVHPVLRTLEIYEQREGGYRLTGTREETARAGARRDRARHVAESAAKAGAEGGRMRFRLLVSSVCTTRPLSAVPYAV